MKYLIVSTTLENKKEAENMAKKIVGLKLGACVQISKISSFYNWKGNIQENKEIKMDIKTTSEKHKKLGKFIVDNHKYDLPEIIVTKFRGYEKYLNWIRETLK